MVVVYCEPDEKTAKKDPKGAAELTLKLAEFCTPRWQRITVDVSKLPIEDSASCHAGGGQRMPWGSSSL